MHVLDILGRLENITQHPLVQDVVIYLMINQPSSVDIHFHHTAFLNYNVFPYVIYTAHT